MEDNQTTRPSDNRTTLYSVLIGCASGLIAVPVLLLLVITLVSFVKALTGRGSSTNVESGATLLVSCFLIPVVIGAIYFITTRKASGHAMRTVGCAWLAVILITTVVVSIVSLAIGTDPTSESDTEIGDSLADSDETRVPTSTPVNEVPPSLTTEINTATVTVEVASPRPSAPPPTNTPTLADTVSVTRPPQCQAGQNDEDIPEFSILEILDVDYIDGAVRIMGCTDLPDQALLDVSFDITDYLPDDSYAGVSTQTQVTDGFYEASLVPPNIVQYQQGPYEIEVWFRANESQPSTVLELVGSKGEHLVGKRVWQLATADNTLIITSTVDLALNIVLPTYPQIDPSVYERNFPERTLAEFLLAWQNEDWETMASLTQLTWRDSKDDPQTELEYMFGFKTLLGAEIISDESPISDNYSVPSVILYYALNPTWVKTVLVQPSVIREDKPYNPSNSGVWGVNPIAMLEETELDPTSNIVTATPSISPTTMLDANITAIDTISYANVARYAIYVALTFPVSEDAIIELCEQVVEDFKGEQSFNAVAVYFSDLDAHYFGFTIARCHYAPNGEWGDSNTVSTGDYSQHEYSYQFQPKVSEPTLAIVEMPSEQEVKLCDEWMVTAESLIEAGYDPVTESEDEANRLLAEKYYMQVTEVEETLLKCVLWSSR